MPWYEVEHRCSRSGTDKEALASQLTSRPRFPCSWAATRHPDCYLLFYFHIPFSKVGLLEGQETFNGIKSYAREGHSDKEELQSHCRHLTSAWKEVMMNPLGELESCPLS